MKLTQLVDDQRYPNLRHFCEDQLEMQVNDIRCLLRLPNSEFDAGCNLATASLLTNIIGGASVCLYNASITDLKKQGGRGKRLKNLMSDYYPWKEDAIQKSKVIDVVYFYTRNPLVHSLGVYAPQAKLHVTVSKSPMTIAQIDSIENSGDQPTGLPPIMKKEALNTFEISISTLYWGVIRILKSLLTTNEQAAKSEAFFEYLTNENDIKATGLMLSQLKVWLKYPERNPTIKHAELESKVLLKLSELTGINSGLTKEQEAKVSRLQQSFGNIRKSLDASLLGL